MRHSLSSANINIFQKRLTIFIISGSKDKEIAFSYIVCDAFDCYSLLKGCFD